MDAQEQQFYDAMVNNLGDIDPWLKRLDADTRREELPPRSPLAADDRATSPYHLSHAAWFALHTAVDHLHLHRTAVREAGVIHTFAPYTLLRGAFENACTAVWLLAPPSRDERVLRRLRHYSANINNAERIAAVVGADDATEHEQRRRRIVDVGLSRGFTRKQVLERLSPTEVVTAAGGHSAMGETRARLVWGLCSGSAHGDFWSLPTLAHHVELPGAPDGIAHLRVTGDASKLHFLTFYAVAMARNGWSLYDKRSTPPYVG